MTTNENESYLTVPEVARIFEVGKEQVREWAREGKLDGEKVKNQWLITASSVKTLVNRRYGRS